MKIKLNTLIVFSIIAVAITVAAAITIYSQTQNGDISSTQNSQKQDEATEVQEGFKTARQKDHGKLYKGYGSRKIKDLPGNPSEDISIEVGTGLYVFLPNEPPFNAQSFLTEIGYDADAVIIGTPKSKKSQITEDEAFIFTDYEVAISEVLKGNLTSPSQAGENIVVTRTGGKIKYKGRVISAVDEGFRPFHLGNQYLLFLKYIPSTSSYQAFRNGSFRLQDDKIEQLGGSSNVVKTNDNITAFLSQVNAALAMPCAAKTVPGSVLQ